MYIVFVAIPKILLLHWNDGIYCNSTKSLFTVGAALGGISRMEIRDTEIMNLWRLMKKVDVFLIWKWQLMEP